MQTISDRKKAAPLFENFKWNYMAQSILEGNHGEVSVDDPEQPNLAILYLPELRLGIVGGDPAHPAAEAYISGIKKRSFLMFADRYEGWDALGKKYHDVAFFQVMRYAFTSENLNVDYLKTLRDCDLGELVLKPLDLEMVRALSSEKSEITEDHFLNFATPAEFIEKGFGFAILEGKQVVSLATSFVVCDGGIEIQINTRKKYEGRGLGTTVGGSSDRGEPGARPGPELGRGYRALGGAGEEAGLHRAGRVPDVRGLWLEADGQVPVVAAEGDGAG